jgi:hypothetical protein
VYGNLYGISGRFERGYRLAWIINEVCMHLRSGFRCTFPLDSQTRELPLKPEIEVLLRIVKLLIGTEMGCTGIEIIRYFPDEFRSEEEIYRLKRNIMERLMRNIDKIRWRLSG